MQILIPMNVLASEAAADRLDRRMLEAILIFLRYSSYPLIAISIGMFVYSIKNEDGAMKTSSLKIFGISMLLFSLHSLCVASGLC